MEVLGLFRPCFVMESANEEDENANLENLQ